MVIVNLTTNASDLMEIQEKQQCSYCNLPVKDHAVVIIKGEVSTEQSEQQHPHAPYISLEVTHNTPAAECYRKDFWVMHQLTWSGHHGRAKLSYFKAVNIEHVLPLIQCMLFPGWVQGQRMQDSHNKSSAHNPNHPEQKQPHDNMRRFSWNINVRFTLASL